MGVLDHYADYRVKKAVAARMPPASSKANLFDTWEMRNFAGVYGEHASSVRFSDYVVGCSYATAFHGSHSLLFTGAYCAIAMLSVTAPAAGICVAFTACLSKVLLCKRHLRLLNSKTPQLTPLTNLFSATSRVLVLGCYLAPVALPLAWGAALRGRQALPAAATAEAASLT